MQRTFFYLVCVFIAYGSLYPFEFYAQISQESIEAFLFSWRPSSSRGDVLGNIALFIPFGFLGYRLQPLWRLSLIGLLVAFGLQAAQLYLPTRLPALYDVYWNLAGIAIGFAGAYLLNPYALFQDSRIIAEKHSAIALLMLWGASQLLPLVPTLDWQSYKNAVKPLILSPRFVEADFLFLTVAWMVAAHFTEEVLGKLWRGIYLLISIMLVLALKIVIVRNQLNLSDLLAGITAAALFPLARQTTHSRTDLWAWLLLFSYLISALFPLQLQSETKSFSWLPFSGFLDGSMVANSRALCKKLFVFAGIFLLLKKAKSFSLLTVSAVTVVVTLVELWQLWIAGRTAEITDPLLVILMAWLIAQTQMAAPSRPEVQEGAVIQAAAILRASFLSQSTNTSLKANDEVLINRAQKRNVIFTGFAASLAIAFCFYVIVRLPNVPYNVRELFRYGGTGIDLFIFGLALLAMGAGPAWMGRNIATSKKPVLKAPYAAIIVSITIYFLIYKSVSWESMKDITGSQIFVHLVGDEGALGEVGKAIVAVIGADNLQSVANNFEPVVRFGALFGPIIIFLGLIFASFFQNHSGSVAQSSQSFLSFCRQLFIYVIYMLPWLYFCKVIAFDWSSTDNLYELIAPEGDYGMGGGGYLYGLIGLISLLAGCLAWFAANGNNANAMALLALSIVSVAPGWLLLNAGLTDNVGKYGLNFSGVDFLLGPDRRHLLSTTELILRWAGLQFFATVGLAFGAMLYLKWSRPVVGSKTRGWAKNTPVKGRVLVELRVPLEHNQVKFLKGLAVQMGENFSSTLVLIISFLQEEMERSIGVQKLVYDEIKKYAEQKENKISGHLAVLKLPAAQVKTITQIQINAEVGGLDVIGGLVAIFRRVAISTGPSQSDLRNR
ncbi:conserved membrane hypothetical protein [Candidatus Methylobacter favarea]|uniref:VanZ-like domain-containing protein n=1 Tax=Candidatus Methylobacter favarea TaxID=2707345 RepID=A0A8S0YAN9_9GAMM|nr:VanZ family protein [Candidatus Methylobacter favarea]CAA9892287.1 conserved membrane hypothetical protein [Candidatus Methylobacter favarea]